MLGQDPSLPLRMRGPPLLVMLTVTLEVRATSTLRYSTDKLTTMLPLLLSLLVSSTFAASTVSPAVLSQDLSEDVLKSSPRSTSTANSKTNLLEAILSPYNLRYNATPVTIIQVINLHFLPELKLAAAPKRKVTPAPGSKDADSVEPTDNSIFFLPKDPNRFAVEVFGVKNGKRVPPPERITAIIYNPQESVMVRNQEGNYKQPLNLPIISDGPLVYPVKEVLRRYRFLDQEKLTDRYINELIDFILDIVRQELQNRGEDEVAIPDIHKEIGTQPTNMVGKFDATNGWLKSLTTVQRTSDVVITRSGSTLFVNCSAGLKVMMIGYDHYDAEMIVHASGNIIGNVSSNSVATQFSINVAADQCRVKLEHLRVEKIGPMDIQVTGLGSLDWLLSHITTWVTNKYKEEIVPQIEEHISTLIQQTLDRVHCDRSTINLLHAYAGNEEQAIV